MQYGYDALIPTSCKRHEQPCIAQGMSIACSTPEALMWDPEWAGTHEISGRAMKNVHTAGNDFSVKRSALALSLACSPE